MAHDKIRPHVKNALIKDGWIITHDPFTISYKDATVFADLAAEHPIAAEKSGHKIIVEIKSFIGKSAMKEFEAALGQYQTYLPFLQKLGFEHHLYLAVGTGVYQQFFQRPSIQLLIDWYKLSIMVVNLTTEEIEQWIN